MLTMLAEVELAISTNAVYVGLGSVCVLLGGAIMATAKVISILSSIDNRLKELETKVSETFTVDQAMNFALRAKMENPELRVPHPTKEDRLVNGSRTGEKGILET